MQLERLLNRHITEQLQSLSYTTANRSTAQPSLNITLAGPGDGLSVIAFKSDFAEFAHCGRAT